MTEYIKEVHLGDYNLDEIDNTLNISKVFTVYKDLDKRLDNMIQQLMSLFEKEDKEIVINAELGKSEYHNGFIKSIKLVYLGNKKQYQLKTVYQRNDDITSKEVLDRVLYIGTDLHALVENIRYYKYLVAFKNRIYNFEIKHIF